MVGALSYRRARAELERATDARLELLGRDVAQNLHRVLTGHVTDTTTWARLETMIALTFGDVDKQIADFMREALGSDQAYVAIGAYDGEGGLVASVGAVDRLPGIDGAPATVRLSRVDGAENEAGLLRLDVPVFSTRRPGDRIGTLTVLLAGDRLLDQLVADRVAGTAATVTLLAGGRHLAQSGGGNMAGPFLETGLAVPPLAGVQGLPLYVAAREPVEIALASVDQLRRTLVAISILVVLFSGLLGGLVAWRVSVPIRRLTGAVEAIADHGRPEPIAETVGASGEIGVLAAAFDTMLERLAVAQREVIGQSKLALLGEVAASIGHDVRTPLSVLKTSAQLLGSTDLSADEQRDLAAMVTSEVDRLNRVVTSLTDLAHARPAERVARPVTALVDRAVAVLRPWARAHGVTIETRGSERPRVVVDPDEMQQVLINLLHNGVQASPAGGRITIGWREADGGVVIEVSDTGQGFTPEALERAFSPFFTTKSDGTGLGLAIVRRVVHAHGGEVGARNLGGRGACVWIRLPAET